jgi:hypothetical protein
MRRNQETCSCPAYAFPHREGSGKCPGAAPVCTECKQLCTPALIDFGIGRGEHFGTPFNDVREEWVSSCCESEMWGFDEEAMGPDPDEARERERDDADWFNAQ